MYVRASDAPYVLGKYDYIRRQCPMKKMKHNLCIYTCKFIIYSCDMYSFY